MTDTERSLIGLEKGPEQGGQGPEVTEIREEGEEVLKKEIGTGGGGHRPIMDRTEGEEVLNQLIKEGREMKESDTIKEGHPEEQEAAEEGVVEEIMPREADLLTRVTDQEAGGTFNWLT